MLRAFAVLFVNGQFMPIVHSGYKGSILKAFTSATRVLKSTISKEEGWVISAFSHFPIKFLGLLVSNCEVVCKRSFRLRQSTEPCWTVEYQWHLFLAGVMFLWVSP